MSKRAIFLDRDGVIAVRRSRYVKKLAELELLPGVAETLRILRDIGFNLIVVTNQSMIDRGLSTHSELARIHRRMVEALAEGGCRIDAVYYCPHRPEENCSCRKPRSGLILRASREHSIDLGRSWMLGDERSDLEAGKTAGCRVLEVRTNEPASLRRAVEQIVEAEG